MFVSLGLLFTFVAPYLVPDQHPLRNDRLAAAAERLAREQGVADIPVRVEDVDAVHGRAQRVRDRPRPDPPGDPLEHAARPAVQRSRGARRDRARAGPPLPRPPLEAVGVVRAGRRCPWRWLIARAHAPPGRDVRGPRGAARPADRGSCSRSRSRRPRTWSAAQVRGRGRLGRARRPPRSAGAARAVRELAETSQADPRAAAPGRYVLFDTHPTAMQRIEMVEAWRARNGRP